MNSFWKRVIAITLLCSIGVSSNVNTVMANVGEVVKEEKESWCGEELITDEYTMPCEICDQNEFEDGKVSYVEVDQWASIYNSVITNPSGAAGTDYTSSPSLARELDSIFSGDVNIYTVSNGVRKEHSFPLGTSLNNDMQYYAYTSGGAAVSGWQCYIYAQAAYIKLFDERVIHGTENYNHSRVVMSGGTNSLSYDKLKNAGVKCGAYVRSTDSSNGTYNGSVGHSFLILSYDTSNITILEGNADGNGLVRITTRTWSDFNKSTFTSKTRYLSHIVQPTDEYYESKYGDRIPAVKPSRVENLTSNKKVYSTSESVRFTWSAASEATNYKLYLSKDGVEQYNYDAGNATSYSISSLSEGKYTMKIKPGNSAGYNDDSPSCSFVVTSDGKPYPVTDLKASKVLYKTNESVTINWSAVFGATKYYLYVYRNGELLSENNQGTSCAFETSQLVAGEYTIRVRPGNENGFNENGNTVSFNVINSDLSKYHVIEDGRYYIVPELTSDKNVSIAGLSKDNGANIELGSNTNDPNQSFEFTYLNDGYYKIINPYSGKCIELENSSQNNDVNIRQYDYTGSDNQKWLIKSSRDGKFYNIISKSTGLCVTLYNADTTNGTNILGRNPHFGTSQKWNFVAFEAKDIASCDISIGQTPIIYNGDEKKAEIIIKNGSWYLEEGRHYTVEYKNNINAGKATAIITGIGNYKGSVSRTFNIQRKHISDSSIVIQLEDTTYTYNGSEKCPVVSVKNGSYTMREGEHYQVTYSNNINAGTAQVLVEGIGNYSGSVTKTFEIQRRSVMDQAITVELEQEIFAFNRTEICPAVTVKNGAYEMREGEHYKVTYKNNINVGTAEVVVEGIGNYSSIIHYN